MTWTYQDTMPTEKDKVRFYIGDTTAGDPMLSDQEIEFALSEAGGDVRAAATLCLTRKAAEWARLADLKEGQLSISYSQRSQQMLALADVITTTTSLFEPPMPSAGGIFVADKQAAEGDTGRVVPSFNVDMLDNEQVGPLKRAHTHSEELE